MTRATFTSLLSALCSVAFLSTSANAQPPAPAVDACAAKEYHQLDFMLGQWSVSEVAAPDKPLFDASVKHLPTNTCGLSESVVLASGLGGNGQLGYSRAYGGWVYVYTSFDGTTNYLHDSKLVTGGVEFKVTRWLPGVGNHESTFSVIQVANNRLDVKSVYADGSGKLDYDFYWTKKP